MDNPDLQVEGWVIPCQSVIDMVMVFDMVMVDMVMVFLSPSVLYTEHDPPHQLPILLVILVVLVFFSIVTYMVVSLLLNVVSSIRFRTRIQGRLDLFFFSTLSRTPFPHLISHTTKFLLLE